MWLIVSWNQDKTQFRSEEEVEPTMPSHLEVNVKEKRG